MDRIKVYHFRIWDHEAGAFVIPPEKSPAERIRRIGGEIMRDTVEYVDRWQLDAEQRYLVRDPVCTEA